MSYTSPFKLISEPIVISGMSGRLPESDTIDEFAQNLYNNVDMVTEDDRRWPTGWPQININSYNNFQFDQGTFGMNHRMGKIKNIDKIDGLFFGLLKTLGDTVDPQSRILLETSYEAIIDAGIQTFSQLIEYLNLNSFSGINPQTLRGSNTGVYIGYSSFSMPDGMPEDLHPDSQFNVAEVLSTQQGQAKCLYANRISFFLDLRGPSQVVDTACSSSQFALNTALIDLNLGLN